MAWQRNVSDIDVDELVALYEEMKYRKQREGFDDDDQAKYDAVVCEAFARLGH